MVFACEAKMAAKMANGMGSEEHGRDERTKDGGSASRFPGFYVSWELEMILTEYSFRMRSTRASIPPFYEKERRTRERRSTRAQHLFLPSFCCLRSCSRTFI